MLDKPEKTLALIATLKAAAPFEVEMTQQLQVKLRAENIAADIGPRQMVRDISYAGEEGGILCRIEPDNLGKALVVSLTHLTVRRNLPFAAAVLDYQKHRLKKLKKQHSMT